MATDHTGTIIITSVVGTLAAVVGLTVLATRKPVREAAKKAKVAVATEVLYHLDRRQDKKDLQAEIRRAEEVFKLKQAGARRRIKASVEPRLDYVAGQRRAKKALKVGTAAERLRQLNAERDLLMQQSGG